MARIIEPDHADGCTTSRVEDVLATPHILIVEEQPAIQQLLCWMLQLAGYPHTVCTGRQAALTWMDKTMPVGNAPVVVLLDLSLPGMKEAEIFLGHFRAHWQDTLGLLPQIIVLTTNPQIHAQLEGKEHVLQKPFHVRELLAYIRRVTLGALA